MIKKHIRIHQKNAAFVYAILESLDGLTAFSTLPGEADQNWRTLELFIPESQQNDLAFVLESMRKKFPILEMEEE